MPANNPNVHQKEKKITNCNIFIELNTTLKFRRKTVSTHQNMDTSQNTEEKKPDTKENLLYNSIYVNFKNWQNYLSMKDDKIVIIWEGYITD